MCGITGFLCRTPQRSDEELGDHVHRMNETLRHRGPDAGGTWTDAAAGIALGHRRLSILDLTPAGNQPMHSACGRFCIVYNGEIYNHGELRRDLESHGQTFRGHSDTETLIEAVARWGVEATVQRCIGMFVFALWDKRERRLILVRDRLGIKPLYYGWHNDVFLFGSELKALREHPAFDGEIDREALTLFVRHNYVPAPWSIYRGILKLPPGTMLTLSAEQGPENTRPVAYWSLEDVVRQGREHPFVGSKAAAVDELESLLGDAVQQRMISDVPLGAFLSGGIDSSAVVALMQSRSDRPVRTFSIGFDEPSYNEAPYAKAIAEHLGTDHVEYYVSPKEAQDVIPRLPHLYDEPFADSSQIPTHLVSEIARRHVTVSLSGDGGDELFGGYLRYDATRKFWSVFRWFPRSVRPLLSRTLRAIAPRLFAKVLTRRTYTLADLVAIPDVRDVYLRLMSHWSVPEEIVISDRYPAGPVADPHLWACCRHVLDRVMYVDTLNYLPDDILVKVDRASMGVSLEARVPVLDHRVVEFAWTLPRSFKVCHGEAKWVLRQVLERHVPRHLFDRPKVGFGIPINEWLRGPLRDWAESLLDEHRLSQEGYFHPSPIRRRWEEHISGKRDWHYYIWDILMFQAWLDWTGR